MENLGYYNGKFGLLEEMTVPMLDRVCYFGDGVYDATYSRNHNIFALDEHVERFYNSAGLLGIKICALNPKNNIDIKNFIFLTEIIKINEKNPVKSKITIKLAGNSKNIEKYFGWIYYINIVLVSEKKPDIL